MFVWRRAGPLPDLFGLVMILLCSLPLLCFAPISLAPMTVAGGMCVGRGKKKEGRGGAEEGAGGVGGFWGPSRNSHSLGSSCICFRKRDVLFVKPWGCARHL